MKPHQNTIALKPDRTGFAVVMIVFGTSLVACSDLATKWLTANLSLWQLQSMRSVFGISFLLLILLATKKIGSLKVINVEALVIRSLLMTFTYLTFFTALAVLPIAMVAGGFFSGPLFMVVLAAVILKEQIGSCLRFCLCINPSLYPQALQKRRPHCNFILADRYVLAIRLAGTIYIVFYSRLT